ncbi:hypothetical protein [Oribacterium sp. P6A1]|uniref:hypothetical protein n=1 Tax=Oribacterium sp. P6A1 TaxID=1410612 RepID=UPI00056A18E0|nr:hypothetical protein [Oribacterium sp. P6A1]
MGYGSYSASDWSKLKASRKLSNDQNVEEVFKRRSCDPKFDPRFIGTRECFDSQDHPHSTPIVVGLDVTASMGYLAVKVATEALNDLITKLYSTNTIEDPALMCAAYGDFRDESPLQVTQFESDIRIAEQLLNLYFENHGNGEVVPTCLWEFLSRHTNIDAINKRGEKGFLFTIGDGAEIRTDSVSETIKRVTGDYVPCATVESLLAEVQQKFHVFHIMIGEEGNRGILAGRKIVIGKDAVNVIPDIIFGVIRMQKGERQEDILASYDNANRLLIHNALKQISLSDVGHSITL